MSEGEYLDSQSDCGASEYMREHEQEQYCKSLDAMQRRYNDNKRAAVCTIIQCACCARKIIKKSYQTQFCSNKGKGNCKDTYHNNVNDTRRERSHNFY